MAQKTMALTTELTEPMTSEMTMSEITESLKLFARRDTIGDERLEITMAAACVCGEARRNRRLGRSTDRPRIDRVRVLTHRTGR